MRYWKFDRALAWVMLVMVLAAAVALLCLGLSAALGRGWWHWIMVSAVVIEVTAMMVGFVIMSVEDLVRSR